MNMGGEMIYILHQRLQAQSIPEEKSRKGVHTVVGMLVTCCCHPSTSTPSLNLYAYII